MNRAQWLQDRRMQKFVDVLSRWEAGCLSMLEAGELLGVSERQFRRYRDRYEDDGLEGLRDGRLGKPSGKRVPAGEKDRVLRLYREAYRDWNVKHFHEHLRRDHGFRWGYTWVKAQLHGSGLVVRAPRRGVHRRKRERKPCEGMMLHQDGSRAAWLAGQSEVEAANRWIRQVYLPRHNARFARPATLADSGFVRVADPGSLAETLCIEEERVVDRANTVSFGRLKLQLPPSPLRAHYVKARVRVRQYCDGGLAVFHGPRCVARFDDEGRHRPDAPTCASATSCSPRSRTLRAACGGASHPVVRVLPPAGALLTAGDRLMRLCPG